MTDNRYTRAARSQGFDENLNESPIDTPDGWQDGSVNQTGGFIMVRIWRTWAYDGEKARDVEYECAYGENPGVSIQAYEWSDEFDGYEFKEVVETREVAENTDERKAAVAREMMETFDREN